MLMLNKLRKFARNAAPVQAPPVSAPTIDPPRPRLPPAPPLSQAALIAMANPRSFSCEHCKAKASDVTSIMYTECPSFKLWLCAPCTAYYFKHQVLPPVTPPRVLPVLLRKKT